MIRPDDAALYAERFARRLPDWDQRRRVAADAGLEDAQIAGDPGSSWRLLIKESANRDRWPELATAAARAAPDDASLAGIAAAANAGHAWRPEGWFSWLLGAGATLGATAISVMLIAAILAVVAVPRLLPVGPRAAAVPVAAEPVAAVPVPAVPAAPEPVAAAAPAKAAPAVGARAPDPIAPKAPVKAPVAVPVVDRPRLAAPAAAAGVGKPVVGKPVVAKPVVEGLVGGCAGAAAQADGMIGWGYAGNVKPVIEGGHWRPVGSVNLRVAPPSKESGWKPGASRCTILPGGDLVVDPPVFVPRDSWWVPVKAVRRGGAAPG